MQNNTQGTISGNISLGKVTLPSYDRVMEVLIKANVEYTRCQERYDEYLGFYYMEIVTYKGAAVDAIIEELGQVTNLDECSILEENKVILKIFYSRIK